MKLFIIELIYGREIRITADRHVKEGDRFVFYSNTGTRVDDVLCEIVSTIRDEADPNSIASVAPSSAPTLDTTVPASSSVNSSEMNTAAIGNLLQSIEGKRSLTCNEFMHILPVFFSLPRFSEERMSWRAPLHKHCDMCSNCNDEYRKAFQEYKLQEQAPMLRSILPPRLSPDEVEKKRAESKSILDDIRKMLGS